MTSKKNKKRKLKQFLNSKPADTPKTMSSSSYNPSNTPSGPRRQNHPPSTRAPRREYREILSPPPRVQSPRRHRNRSWDRTSSFERKNNYRPVDQSRPRSPGKERRSSDLYKSGAARSPLGRRGEHINFGFNNQIIRRSLHLHIYFLHADSATPPSLPNHPLLSHSLARLNPIT